MLFEAAIEYKAVCEILREHHEKFRSAPPDFALNPDHVVVNAVMRTVTLSIAAENIAMATGRELDELRRKLGRDSQVL